MVRVTVFRWGIVLACYTCRPRSRDACWKINIVQGVYQINEKNTTSVSSTLHG